MRRAANDNGATDTRSAAARRQELLRLFRVLAQHQMDLLGRLALILLNRTGPISDAELLRLASKSIRNR